jgi:hypothetical protein
MNTLSKTCIALAVAGAFTTANVHAQARGILGGVYRFRSGILPTRTSVAQRLGVPMRSSVPSGYRLGATLGSA